MHYTTIYGIIRITKKIKTGARLTEKETRIQALESFTIETRATEPGTDPEQKNKMILEGYAVVFDKITAIGDPKQGGFYEVIDKRAFDNCYLKDVPLKYNHSDSVPILARTRNKSLKLSIDNKGLKITAELLDTQDAKDMYKRVKAGLIDKMSFAFMIADGGEDITEIDGAPLRRITNIKRLFDCSIVDTPAYDDTSVYARSLEHAESWKQATATESKEAEERKAQENELKIILMRWTK